MKKIIAMLSALVLCLSMVAGLAAAEEATNENLAAAETLLNFMYRSKNREKLTTTAEDYEVVSQLVIDGVIYPVTWTTDMDTIQIVPGENAKTLIDLDDNNPKEATYTLTATVTDPNGETLSVSYQRIMPAAMLEMSYADIVNAAYALEQGAAMSKPQRLFGTIVKINDAYSEEYKNITVTIQVGDMADQPVQCYRLSGEGCDKLAEGDAITVEGILKNYKGTIEFDKGCVLVGMGEIVSQAAVLDAAYALEAGAALSTPTALEGVITKINDAWSEEYKNITVTIVCDGKEEQPIECYRLTGEGADKLAEGDTIAVTGSIKNYKGTIEFDKGCKLIPVGTARDVRTVLRAYTLEEGKAMTSASTLTGVITAIPNAWSEEYKNITVNMVVAGLEDNVIQCYRLSGEGCAELAEGDTITVTGTIKNYKGTIEFDKGCTLDAVVKAE